MASANQYARAAVVAGAPTGDYETPQAAMADLTNWCGTPSATNPCLIKVMPGVYDLGATPLLIVPYVDLEGSGANGTKLVGQVRLSQGAWTGITSDVRSITIEKTGSSRDYAAFYCGAEAYGASIKLKDVTISGLGGAPGVFFDSTCVVSLDRSVVTASAASGDVMGIYFNNGDTTGGLTVNDSGVSATGGTNSYGVYLRGHGGNGMTYSPIRIRDTSISASGASGVDTGILNISNQNVEFTDLEVTSGDIAIQNGIPTYNVSGNVRLAASRLAAPTTVNNVGGWVMMSATRLLGGANGGVPGLIGMNYLCIGVHNSSYLPVTCPP